MTRDVQINYIGGKRTGFKAGPVILSFATLLIIGALSFFYLSQTNETVTKGYEIKELEKNLEGLKAENHELELRAAELQSIEKVKEKTDKLNMIKITGAYYIQLKEEELARR